MTGITMDGVHYGVRVRYESTNRSFQIMEGDNSGFMLSGQYRLDSYGTYYNYQMEVEPDPQHPEQYDAFFDAISDPSGVHTVVMPYGQQTITLQVKVISGGDTNRGKLAGVRRWGGLKVNFQAIQPSRLPAEVT